MRLTSLSHPLGMICPLYGLGKFELLFLGWFCPIYGPVKYKLFQDESVHFMDLRMNLSTFMDWSSFWMNQSSYGLVILTRGWTRLFYELTISHPLGIRPTHFVDLITWTYPLDGLVISHPLRMKCIHFVDLNPSTLWTYH